ncbi:hypothetical protein DPMN_039758 [Dreissena polymorpha]|uniref:Uncharacterized protein n=1 Tax=Dreissena polymorpha TaxID=45954 RepID=A0A9D4CVJ4_DREPO|nr:hypothetical protein DPMN_039758 [Dreissena polymorpha]
MLKAHTGAVPGFLVRVGGILKDFLGVQGKALLGGPGGKAPSKLHDLSDLKALTTTSRACHSLYTIIKVPSYNAKKVHSLSLRGHRKLHNFNYFEGFDNNFSSMSRLMYFYQSTFI